MRALDLASDGSMPLSGPHSDLSGLILAYEGPTPAAERPTLALGSHDDLRRPMLISQGPTLALESP